MATLGKWLNARPITPSDSLALTGPVGALTVGVTGTVTVDTVGGQTNVTLTLVAGFQTEVAVTKVYATGTTATGICGYW
jgi:hypothetical protein